MAEFFELLSRELSSLNTNSSNFNAEIMGFKVGPRTRSAHNVFQLSLIQNLRINFYT